MTRTFLSFLNSFSSEDANADAGGEGAENPSGYRDYVEQLELMYERSGTTIYVNFQHLMEFDGVLAHEAVEANFYKYQPFLRRAAVEFVRQHKPAMVRWDGGKEKEFWVAFVNLPRVHRLRELKAENIGQLTSFSGTVTRTSEVRPELLLGAFRCAECDTLRARRRAAVPVHHARHLPQRAVREPHEVDARAGRVQVRGLAARVRVQENASEVPAGSLPRLDGGYIEARPPRRRARAIRRCSPARCWSCPRARPATWRATARSWAAAAAAARARSGARARALGASAGWACASSFTAWCLSRTAW